MCNYQNRSGCRIPRGVPGGLPNFPPPGANFSPNLPVQPGGGTEKNWTIHYGGTNPGGTWYLGGYICSIWGLADPPIHLPKLSAQTHPATKCFAIFCYWTQLSTKIWRSNPSIWHFLPIFALEPIYLPTFYAQTHPSTKISSFFWKWPNHQPFKTNPSTSIIRIYENMWVPPPPGYK